MSGVDPDALWGLVVTAGLADATRIQALRREFEGLPFPPGAQPMAAAELAARWLVKRGIVTPWQAKRLLRGESGPFFVGDYRLLDRLEAPAPNAFRARHEPTGREVSLVVLATKRCVPEVWADIVQRTKAAHAARDPVLVRTLALEKADKQRFIVCEPVGGGPMAEQLAARGPLPPAEAAAVTLEVARAVAHLHRLGCVHGGISLDALWREPPPVNAQGHDGPVRLLQFPLAGDPHVVPPKPAVESPEAIALLGGRASFIAPELARGTRPADTRSDVYSLGCVFHALLTGALPCWQGDPARTLSQALTTGPAALGADVPVELATLVGYMTARDPARRYPTAVEAADAIAMSLGQPPLSNQLPAQQPFFAGGGPGEQAAPADEPADPPAPLVTVTAPRRPVAAKPRGRGHGLALGGLGLLAATVAVASAVLWMRPQRVAKPRVNTTTGATADPRGADNPPGSGPTAAPVAEPGAGAPLSPDAAAPPPAPGSATDPGGSTAAVVRLVDGTAGTEGTTALWAAPGAAGPPPRLAHLPPGAQLMLLARPAALLATAEGRLFLRATGPDVEAALDALSRLCGTPADQLEVVQVGWRDDAAGPSRDTGGLTLGAVAWGAKPLPVGTDEAVRAIAWGERQAREISGETIYPGEPLTFWLPRRHAGRALVMGPEPLVEELVAAEAAGGVAGGGGVEASLPRDLEILVDGLDSGRHVTLLGSPAWLVQDGSHALGGPLARLVDPLARFFGEGVRAAALGLQFGDTSYAELDVVAPTDTRAERLAAALGERIVALPAAAEAYCNALDPHPFGRRLVMRLPRMLEVLADNLRAGGEGPLAIVNCHLPPHAAHNLALAVELALAQTPASAAPAVAATTPAPAATGAREKLARRITLTFTRDTLEKSIQMLAEETGLPMEILGGDLQLEGITKNQSFGLDERDKPAEEILRRILANSNPDGKLVYVIRNTDGMETLAITTRAAATKRGDTLPPGFDPPPRGDTTR
ncbi:MAG: hypothetical protein EBR86_08040 [Planctomycetia bacterium]|nr:hypothetical protein [Planctomycetia bacterium]